MVRGDFLEAVQAAGQAFPASLVEGVEQVQPVQVGEHRGRPGVRFGVVFLQGHRHAVGGVEDRQGVVERQVLAQQQDQLLPETVAADLFDGAAQAGVHADVPEQGVHPYSLHGGFSQAPVCGFSTRRVKGRNPKG